jgi:hypothetical protein
MKLYEAIKSVENKDGWPYDIDIRRTSWPVSMKINIQIQLAGTCHLWCDVDGIPEYFPWCPDMVDLLAEDWEVTYVSDD